MLNWHLDLLRLHAQLAVSDSPYEIIRDGSDDGGHRAYGWLPLMASSSGSQVGLCAEIFGERILSETNDLCHEGIRIRFLIWKRSTCWLCCV